MCHYSSRWQRWSRLKNPPNLDWCDLEGWRNRCGSVEYTTFTRFLLRFYFLLGPDIRCVMRVCGISGFTQWTRATNPGTQPHKNPPDIHTINACITVLWHRGVWQWARTCGLSRARAGIVDVCTWISYKEDCTLGGSPALVILRIGQQTSFITKPTKQSPLWFWFSFCITRFLIW